MISKSKLRGWISELRRQKKALSVQILALQRIAKKEA